MSQRPSTDDAGAELDDAVIGIARGAVQSAVLGATLLADHRRRLSDAGAAEIAKEASDERQRVAMDALAARASYAHAADPQWVARAGERDLADAWVNAEPWRDIDDVASRVHQLVNDRLRTDWPQLADRYARSMHGGLAPADAMARAARAASNEHASASHSGVDDALRQAGTVEEGHARHVDASHDHETASVDEHVRGMQAYVHDSQRGRDLQSLPAASSSRATRSRYAPSTVTATGPAAQSLIAAEQNAQ